jgi:two-component system CheB/CheR fusion protein
MLRQKEWDIPKLRSLLNEILLLDITVQDYEVTQEFSQLGTRSMSLNACQIDQPNMQKMILVAIEDITERNHQKQLMIVKNQELTEAIATSEAASIAKSKFLGNMSHELRTPLNSIMGFAQILQDNPELDDESVGYLDIIYHAGEYLLSLIEDLLDISRIEAEKVEIVPNILSLSNFLQTTVDMIKFKVSEKKLTLTTKFSPDLPDTIYADERRLRQIILNLLNNAIKFTNTGEITLSVNKIQFTNQTEKTSGLIRFEISDTGVGIPESTFEKIFLPFEQDCESNTKSLGAGLGLAISQSLVNKMGGKIILESAIGVGSTFSFELDLSQPIAL